MAERKPGVPQLDFPQLTADIISELRLAGQVGLLDFSDVVQPVYIIASRGGALGVTADLPAFDPSEIFAGDAFDPAINTVIVDTGQLPAGTYDIFGNINLGGSGPAAGSLLRVEHRNAANAANLATPLVVGVGNTYANHKAQLPLTAITIALNERLRIINVIGNLAGLFAGVIGAKIRPIP